MADWKYPTGAYKAYVPRGQFLRGLGRGIEKFGRGAERWVAQMLAIKQYEAEKEEKRLQRMREKAEQWANIQRQDELQRQADLKAEAMVYREEEFKMAEAEKEREHDIRLAQMKAGEKEPDYRSEIEETITTAQTKVQTPVGKRLLTTADVAYRRGDYGKLAEIYNQVDKIDEQGLLMIMEEVEATEKGGVPTKKRRPSEDYGYLKSTIGKMLNNLEKMTGQRPQAGAGRVSPQGRITVKDLLKRAIEGGDAEAVAKLTEMYGKAVESDPRTGEVKSLIDVLLDELEAEGVTAQR